MNFCCFIYLFGWVQVLKQSKLNGVCFIPKFDLLRIKIADDTQTKRQTYRFSLLIFLYLVCNLIPHFIISYFLSSLCFFFSASGSSMFSVSPYIGLPMQVCFCIYQADQAWTKHTHPSEARGWTPKICLQVQNHRTPRAQLKPCIL